MNTVLLNTFSLDGETVIKKGSGGGGGGIPINNQSKSVEFTENGTSEVRYDAGYTGLEKVSVKVAIPTESKSVTITENGTTEVVADNGFLSKVVVNINVASGGDTTIVSPKDVNFRDYDGTVLYAYTKDEFLALNELPPLPTQSGLICQEWNWSYEDAKAYVNEYGVLEVGATYITDDGRTRLFIEKFFAEDAEISIQYKQSIANGVLVDWGDGSEAYSSSSYNVKAKHTYQSKGNFVISLEVRESCVLTLGATSSTSSGGIMENVSQGDSSLAYCLSLLKKVQLGERANLGYRVFMTAPSLQYITIPKGTTIGKSAFKESGLKSIVIPRNSNIAEEMVRQSGRLEYCVLPSDSTAIETDAIRNNIPMQYIVIPSGVKTIGDFFLYYSYTLRSVIIPSSVESLGSNFCYGIPQLYVVDFSHHKSIPVFNGGLNASTVKVIVPDALYDEWIAATNWSSVSRKIIKKSDWDVQNS